MWRFAFRLTYALLPPRGSNPGYRTTAVLGGQFHSMPRDIMNAHVAACVALIIAALLARRVSLSLHCCTIDEMAPNDANACVWGLPRSNIPPHCQVRVILYQRAANVLAFVSLPLMHQPVSRLVGASFRVYAARGCSAIRSIPAACMVARPTMVSHRLSRGHSPN
jgi:hypothetical protein